jgi:hypothetical protein
MDTIKVNMLEALVEAKGIVTVACKANDNTARSTFYNWYNSDAEFKDAVDDIQNICLDFAEGKLYDLINKGDTTATIFYLKTKGKKRGFIERADDQLPPVIITTTVSKEEVVEIFKTINEAC